MLSCGDGREIRARLEEGVRVGGGGEGRGGDGVRLSITRVREQKQ